MFRIAISVSIMIALSIFVQGGGIEQLQGILPSLVGANEAYEWTTQMQALNN